jgi:hypothetical protein
MLFLYRPRQTWMPYAISRHHTEQVAYNRDLHRRFAATRRVPPAVPRAAEGDPDVADRELEELHRSGALTDDELAAARAKLVAT